MKKIYLVIILIISLILFKITFSGYFNFNTNNVNFECIKYSYFDIKEYNDLKKLKSIKLLTNTKIFSDEINNEILNRKIINPIINGINTKKVDIYIYGNGLGINNNKKILEINSSNVTNMLYLNEQTKKINVTKAFLLELNKKISKIDIIKKENGLVKFDEKGNINVVSGKNGFKIILNIKSIENDINNFYNNKDCDNSFLTIKIKSIKDLTELREGGNHGLKEIIGEYSMNFNNSQDESLKNIQTISGLVNGTIINPFSEFDLGKIIYNFGMNNYEISKIIKGDKIEEEVGGGLCGYATVLYRASLYSGLDIKQRHPHSIYINNIYGKKELGLDSTIYLWGKNLKIINNTGKYIYIKSNFDYKTKKLNILIYGTKKYKSVIMKGPIINKANEKEIIWNRIRDGNIEEIKSEYKKIY